MTKPLLIMRVLPALFIFLLFSVSACRFMGGKRVNGNGVLKSEQRAITGFKGVSVVGGMDVVLIPGTQHSVRIEADENLLQHIMTEIDGDILEISPRNRHNLNPEAGMKVYITAPVFNVVDVSGSGSVTSQSRIKADKKLETEITGSGDIRLDLDAPEVQMEIVGSGTITLSGNTRRFRSEINGSGDLRAFDLMSEDTEVEISGSGDAKVFASKQLGIQINGSGNVDYKGNPPAINQNVSGSGTVRKI